MFPTGGQHQLAVAAAGDGEGGNGMSQRCGVLVSLGAGIDLDEGGHASVKFQCRSGEGGVFLGGDDGVAGQGAGAGQNKCHLVVGIRQKKGIQSCGPQLQHLSQWLSSGDGKRAEQRHPTADESIS